nr:MerR family DNA-binding protein [Rhizobium leguminosarum]
MAPPRTQGRRCRYERSQAARLNFIRHARELGFEVDAIRRLLDMSTQPDRSCAEVDALARRHVAEIDRHIAHLTSLRAELQHTVEECGGRICERRVIETLDDGSHKHERI